MQYLLQACAKSCYILVKYMQIFRLLRYWNSTRRIKNEEERGKTVKVRITSITPFLQDLADVFLNIISFQYDLHFDIGRRKLSGM